MSSMKHYKIINEEEKFARQLSQSLKYYGYLFPENSADVERFEAIYGNTEIEIPEHLESLDRILSDNEQGININMTNNWAAFGSKEKNTFKIPDKIDLNDDNQLPDDND